MEDCGVQVKKVILEENLYYKKNILLNYRIEYPQFFSPRYQKILNKINIFYKSKAYELQQTCYNKYFLEAVDLYNFSVYRGYPVRQFEIISTYTVTFNCDCVLSLYFDQYDYMGGAHGNTLRNSDTWNIKNGNKIFLKDLFSDGINYINYIINIINNQIKLQMIYNENYMYFDNIRKNVLINFDADNFYITADPNGIMIYYQLYEIAPYSMGIPEFYIPYNPYIMVRPTCA